MNKRNKSKQNMMKDFWSTGSVTVESPKATAFSNSGTSCFKLHCGISQSVRETVHYSKPYARKNTSTNKPTTLAFMPPANKVQKDKNTLKTPEMML